MRIILWASVMTVLVASAALAQVDTGLVPVVEITGPMGHFTKAPSAPSDVACGGEPDSAVGRTNFGRCASFKHLLYGNVNPLDLCIREGEE